MFCSALYHKLFDLPSLKFEKTVHFLLCFCGNLEGWQNLGTKLDGQIPLIFMLAVNVKH